MRVWPVVVLACVSCSSGGGSKVTPPDPDPVAVVAGAVGIPPGTPLTFALPAGAAPASFDPANVTLVGLGLPGATAITPTLDAATGTLTVRHGKLLGYGVAYTLAVSGLKDAGGAALTFSVPFRSALNPREQEIYYDADPPPGVYERLPWRYVWEVDALGYITAQLRYFSQGPDGKWSTADDPLNSWYRYEGTRLDPIFTATQLYDKGPDGTWRTADDRIGGVTTWWTDAHGDVRLRVGHGYGGDRTAGTADDAFTCERTVEDAAGRRETMGGCAAGPDGVYDTADDTYAIDTRFVYADGALRQVLAYDAGPDGVAGNGDDRAVQRTDVVYEASRETETTTSCGPDYTLGTADDFVWDAWEYALGSDGRVLQQDYLIDVQGEGRLVIYDRWTFQHDERGMLLSYHRAFTGSDRKPGTRDDLAVSDATYLTDR